MPVYKLVLRDGDNPNTSSLHVIEKYCYANSKNDAQAVFDQNVGPKWVVAGPLKVTEDQVPAGAVFVNQQPS